MGEQAVANLPIERARRLLAEGGEKCWQAVFEINRANTSGMSLREIADGIGRSHGQVQIYLQMYAQHTPEQALSFEDAYAEARKSVRGAPRREREEALRETRREAEEAARHSGCAATVVQADVREWRPEGVASIVTDPPYVTDDAVDLYSHLADFAVETLPNGAPMAVLCWQPILADVLDAMKRPDLRLRWVMAWFFDVAGAVTFDHSRRIFDTWKPVLLFHKEEWRADATAVRDSFHSEGRVADNHRWEQALDATQWLVRSTSEPGHTVADPFVGSGTTGVAALSLYRNFTGADIDPESVETATKRLNDHR